MPRISAKTISMVAEKFIPSSHASNASLHEGAGNIYDRPLVIWWRRLTREERINLSGLIDAVEVVATTEEEEKRRILNLGTLARYVWDNCITKVENVLIDDEAFESLEGVEKNRLFNTNGMDAEISEAIQKVQSESVFRDTEVKN